MSSGVQGKTGLFWLHIKKSAGISVRQMLAPHYIAVDRINRIDRPPCFIQSRKSEYNDILNNFRVPLGDYQFRRCLFAKKFLYPDDFDQHLRFAFSRNPMDRCLSQFHYLWRKKGRRGRAALAIRMARRGRLGSVTSYDFDRFLDAIEEARGSPSHDTPHGLHFKTHTAAMWDDIVDEDGQVLLDHVFRLEDLEKGIDLVRATLGYAPLAPKEKVHLNRSVRNEFTPDRAQRARVEDLFAQDFHIYEGLCEDLRTA